MELDRRLLNAVIDWLDEDAVRRVPGGAEDDVYTRLQQPYRAANRALARVSELLLVDGFDARIVGKLHPHVVALPTGSGLNINAATATLLATIDEDFTGQLVAEIENRRHNEAFDSVRELAALMLDHGISVDVQALTTESRFFAVHSVVRISQRAFRVVTLVESQDRRYRVLQRQVEEV